MKTPYVANAQPIPVKAAGRVFALTCALFTPLLASAVPVSIGIGTLAGQVHVGDRFEVLIAVADVPASTGLASWQFDLSFDPAILSATGVTDGPFLSSFGQTLFVPPIIDNTVGRVIGAADAYIDLPPEPHGSGTLAEIDFTALAVGTSPLTFANVFLNFADTGFSLPAGPVPVPVAAAVSPAAPVPEPPSVWLLAVGLLLLAAVSRLNRVKKEFFQ